jgi:2-iminobutanoate/2-iminopropanoate deaminase
MREQISTDKAPEAIGPYAQAVKIGEMLFTSGQIPIDPKTGALVQGDIKEQMHQVMKNLQEVLKAAGGNFKDVVKTTIFLTDLNHFSLINEIYQSYLEQPYPARSCVEVSALPKGAQVEVEMIASLGK